MADDERSAATEDFRVVVHLHVGGEDPEEIQDRIDDGDDEAESEPLSLRDLDPDLANWLDGRKLSILGRELTIRCQRVSPEELSAWWTTAPPTEPTGANEWWLCADALGVVRVVRVRERGDELEFVQSDGVTLPAAGLLRWRRLKVLPPRPGRGGTR